MGRVRVIPVLLLKNNGLYKTVKFKDPKYVGDPINAIKIFNDKEVDELCVLDINTSAEKRKPNFKLIQEFASECFMPVCYGGGINTIEDAKHIFGLGIEKIALNNAAIENPQLITEIANIYGSQAVVVSVDYKKAFLGNNNVYAINGQNKTKFDVIDFVKRMEEFGAGEILLNSIERDGTMLGYDLETLKNVTEAVKVPVIACGGASNVNDFSLAVKQGGASAVAAGSMFVFQGKLKGVLINFPSQPDLKKYLYF